MLIILIYFPDALFLPADWHLADVSIILLMFLCNIKLVRNVTLLKYDTVKWIQMPGLTRKQLTLAQVDLCHFVSSFVKVFNLADIVKFVNIYQLLIHFNTEPNKNIVFFLFVT